MVTNCSSECSFSKLKYLYIKNRLRTTMTNERVTHLSLMSIEYDILRETDFDDLITDFAQRKGSVWSVGSNLRTTCCYCLCRSYIP